MLRVRAAVFVSGILIIFSMYSYWSSLNVGKDHNSFGCEKSYYRQVTFECLEPGQLPQIFLATSATLSFVSIYILSRIYFIDRRLLRKAVKFSVIYIPVTLLVSTLGLIPREGCLGWVGCYTVYSFKPLLLAFFCIYVAIIHVQVLVPPNMKLSLKSVIYCVSMVTFLSFFWNLFPFLG